MFRYALFSALAVPSLALIGSVIASSAIAADRTFEPAFPHPRPSHMQAVKSTETHALACHEFLTFDNCPSPHPKHS